MKEGVTLWTFEQKENREARNDVMNVYTALYVTDLDDDGVADIVTVHGGDPLAKPGLVQICKKKTVLTVCYTTHQCFLLEFYIKYEIIHGK